MVPILTNWIWKLIGNYENDKVFEYSDLFFGSPKSKRYLTEDPKTDYGDDKIFEHGNLFLVVLNLTAIQLKIRKQIIEITMYLNMEILFLVMLKLPVVIY